MADPVHPPGLPLPHTRRASVVRSPSSPALADALKPPTRPAAPRSISRSKTLPHDDSAILRSNSELDALVVDPENVRKIRRWILGLVLVEFDLDRGPVVSGSYPAFWISPSEAENIAFSAFPDSFQFDQGAQAHSFLIREDTASRKNSVAPQDRPLCADGYIYGFSYFTQRRDVTSKRGYQQRALVILTQHQYPGLFSHISTVLGPLYQTHNLPMLETACHNIATWPDPTPGMTIELGFLGSVLQAKLPQTLDDQQLADTPAFHDKFDPQLHILACSAPSLPPPLLLFEASLSHLWSIWECLVLCEPILVFGQSPAMTSQAVWWLRDLLRPIPQAGDVRPYLTIHDKDNPIIVNKMPPKAGLLIGATNPFIERSCSHWPHILSLGRRLPATKSSSKAPLAAPGPEPGWKTKTHNRYISKDRPLLKRLVDACRGDERARLDASIALRLHFCSRTTALLVPLSRYLNTLLPPPSDSSNAAGKCRLKPFSTTGFFASLKAHGSPLPFRSTSKQKEFYERWLKTPAFGMWLAHQEEVVHLVLKDKAERNSSG
ncbi:hypothetical protein PLICRDRAFT_108142 [Plicaturopsis crispa FD-325 SS-3]|nr:hypothetical protein PLICRDRAFT_108142 [Plicaturopsis crispa FD-325 SS-3]